MKLVGLGRQLALTMAAVALGAVLLVVLTSFGFYYMMFTYWPDQIEPSLLLTWSEVVWLSLTALASIWFAVLVGERVARRILTPLNSLASGIREVAAGDLSVRAQAAPTSSDEVATLVGDFNQLVAKLQQVTEERTFWNAAIAHELRTPITILRGRMQGLVDGVFEPGAALFQGLLTQIEGLGRLVEDLRVISLAEASHLSLHLKPVALADIGRELADIYSVGFAAQGLVLKLELQKASVCCDPVRIRQALQALLENALRYASPGSVTVACSLERGKVRLSVADEGPGMPAEFVPHAFDAYRRAPISTSGTIAGNGLGLAVVAAIATAHGGTARCTSSTDGTLFQIEWLDSCGD